MKRLLACLVIVAVAVAFAVPALAAENAPKAPKRPARGIIVKWNDAARTFTLRIGKGGHLLVTGGRISRAALLRSGVGRAISRS